MLNAHDRIVHLERLVKFLIAKSGNPVDSADHHPPTAPPDTAPGNESERTIPHADERSVAGSMRVSAEGSQYVGGDHWAAILDGIADLKDHFDREEELGRQAWSDGLGDGRGVPRALLLYGCPGAASREEILAALPRKYVADRYVSRYFNRLDLVSACLCFTLRL